MKHFQIGAELTKTEQINMAVEIAQKMIVQDVKDGDVPHMSKLENFVELHDYVDANEYLLGTTFDFSIEEYNQISDTLDRWIRFGH